MRENGDIFLHFNPFCQQGFRQVFTERPGLLPGKIDMLTLFTPLSQCDFVTPALFLLLQPRH